MIQCKFEITYLLSTTFPVTLSFTFDSPQYTTPWSHQIHNVALRQWIFNLALMLTVNQVTSFHDLLRVVFSEYITFCLGPLFNTNTLYCLENNEHSVIIGFLMAPWYNPFLLSELCKDLVAIHSIDIQWSPNFKWFELFLLQ